MKKIEAIIRPHKLQDVKSSLSERGLMGMTVMDVSGYGRQRGHVERYRGAEYAVDLLPKVKIEIVVDEDQLEDAVHVILDSASTGEIGDGKVFVSEVQGAYRVRTGDRDLAAL